MEEVKHISEIIIEKILKPNNMMQKDLQLLMNIDQSTFSCILRKRTTQPNMHFYVMLANVTDTDPEYWIQCHADWMKYHSSKVKKEIKPRVAFDENFKYNGALPIDFTSEERNYFGHGDKAPHKKVKLPPEKRVWVNPNKDINNVFGAGSKLVKEKIHLNPGANK